MFRNTVVLSLSLAVSMSPTWVASHGAVACLEKEIAGVPLRVGEFGSSTGASPERRADTVASKSFLQGADPFVLREQETDAFLYTTNRPGVNVPVYQSRNLLDWVFLGDALPELPGWAKPRKTWAPEVIKTHEERYILYYTANDRRSGKQCIGKGIANRPSGPFVDRSQRPFLCNEVTDTTIDPSPFVDDDGQTYLLWKTKMIDDAGRHVTTIWVQGLTSDGDLQAGVGMPLLTNDLPWEGDHVEAPTLIRRPGRYYLFYSAGTSTSMGYAVNYAVSESLFGPYTKSSSPFLCGNESLKNPGHQSLSRVCPNSYQIFYHSAHPERKADTKDHARYLETGFLCFQGEEPVAQDFHCEGP